VVGDPKIEKMMTGAVHIIKAEEGEAMSVL
jgi:hypothetical protein